MTRRYEDICEAVDASVFSGEILFTDLEAFEEYVNRWKRAIDEHKKSMDYGECEK